MTISSKNKKKVRYGLVLFVLVVFLAMFAPALTKDVLAYENAYIKNTKYYDDITDGLILEFEVKASFDPDVTAYWGRIFKGYGSELSDIYSRNPFCNPDPAKYIMPNLTGGTTFTAGNTYKILLKWLKDGTYRCDYITKSRWEYLIGHTITQADYLISYTTTTQFWKGYIPANTIIAYFSEFPTLSISFPEDQAEITGAFNITGSYTLPAGSDFDKLGAYFGYELGGTATWYSFYQDISVPSGIVNIRISGIPIGSYFLNFGFEDSTDPDNYHVPLIFYEISILESIPQEIEEGIAPPTIFGVFDPEVYYTSNSNYATGTPLFYNLTNSIKPLIQVIGENLTFFSSKFDQAKARETGEKFASAVLMIRSYSSGLNSFFSDLPVSEVLFFYLLLLVIVSVFRLIKNLINLIKP